MSLIREINEKPLNLCWSSVRHYSYDFHRLYSGYNNYDYLCFKNVGLL